MDEDKGQPETPPKPKPKGGGRSMVWKHFTDISKAPEGKHEGKPVVTCHVPTEKGLCNAVLLYSNSTTNMSNHLNLVHTKFMSQSACVIANEASGMLIFPHFRVGQF